MSEVVITPTRATAVFRLPSGFACAYSPGWDLHVSGEGGTERSARENLTTNLRVLAAQLLEFSDEISDEIERE